MAIKVMYVPQSWQVWAAECLHFNPLEPRVVLALLSVMFWLAVDFKSDKMAQTFFVEIQYEQQKT